MSPHSWTTLSTENIHRGKDRCIKISYFVPSRTRCAWGRDWVRSGCFKVPEIFLHLHSQLKFLKLFLPRYKCHIKMDGKSKGIILIKSHFSLPFPPFSWWFEFLHCSNSVTSVLPLRSQRGKPSVFIATQSLPCVPVPLTGSRAVAERHLAQVEIGGLALSEAGEKVGTKPTAWTPGLVHECLHSFIHMIVHSLVHRNLRGILGCWEPHPSLCGKHGPHAGVQSPTVHSSNSALLPGVQKPS